MKRSEILLIVIGIAVAGFLVFDLAFVSRYESKFKNLETERIVTSNQLATAKIVSENLNHVNDLVFHNMEFVGKKNTASREEAFFQFITECVSDLKMRLITIRPTPAETKGRVTTYGYDIQLEGDFFTFGEFCSKVENSRRIMTLTSFNVSSGSSEEKATEQATPRKSLRIQLHLNTYQVRK